MRAGALGPDRTPPRRFWLVRHHDVSGLSEPGIVAEGTVWSSGRVAVHWPGEPVATSLWASLDNLLAVHRHGGGTTVEWIDKGNDWHVHDAAECVEYDNGAIWVH